LEARILRDVYSSAKSYLLTLSGSEYKIRKKENDLEEASILDDVIAVDTEEFDKFLGKLSQVSFRKPTRQETVTKGKLFE